MISAREGRGWLLPGAYCPNHTIESMSGTFSLACAMYDCDVRNRDIALGNSPSMASLEIREIDRGEEKRRIMGGEERRRMRREEKSKDDEK